MVMDLDKLLATSVKLHAARKAKNTHRLLSPEAEELLAQSDKIAKQATWDFIGIVQHIHETRCTCKGSQTQFDGFYELYQHKSVKSSRSLVRCSRPLNNEKLFSHYTTIEVEACTACISIPTAGLMPATYSSLFNQPTKKGDNQSGQTEEIDQDDSEEYSLAD